MVKMIYWSLINWESRISRHFHTQPFIELKESKKEINGIWKSNSLMMAEVRGEYTKWMVGSKWQKGNRTSNLHQTGYSNRRPNQVPFYSWTGNWCYNSNKTYQTCFEEFWFLLIVGSESGKQRFTYSHSQQTRYRGSSLRAPESPSSNCF